MKNSSSLKIAKKYAEALAQIKLDASLVTELEAVSQCFAAGSELNKILANPRLQAKDKQDLIDKCFSGKIEAETMQLLKLLIKRRRLEIASYLGRAYRDAYNAANGLVEANISTASEINKTELDTIKAQLERIFNSKIQITTETDSSLIAGQRISVAGKIIDNSIKTKLKELKHLVK